MKESEDGSHVEEIDEICLKLFALQEDAEVWSPSSPRRMLTDPMGESMVQVGKVFELGSGRRRAAMVCRAWCLGTDTDPEQMVFKKLVFRRPGPLVWVERLRNLLSSLTRAAAMMSFDARDEIRKPSSVLVRRRRGRGFFQWKQCSVSVGNLFRSASGPARNHSFHVDTALKIR